MKRSSTYRKVIRIVSNGVRAWRMSSSGRYETSSYELKEIRREMMDNEGGFSKDRQNLHGDRMRVASDVRESFNKIKAAAVNG